MTTTLATVRVRHLDQWRTLGQAFPREVTEGYYTTPFSTTYHCFECGTHWASIIYPGMQWQCMSKPCRLHGGGSLIHPTAPTHVIHSLPDPIIAYEFELVMEKEQWQRPSQFLHSYYGLSASQPGHLS